MKPFAFTLQALLTLRQHEEQHALELYAIALGARHLAIAQRETSRLQLEQLRDELRQQLTTGRSAALIAQTHAYSRLLEIQLLQAEQHLASAEQSVTKALKSMVAARQKREMVETLRDRRLQRHALEARRSEERVQDELASRRIPTGLMANRNVHHFA